MNNVPTRAGWRWWTFPHGQWTTPMLVVVSAEGLRACYGRQMRESIGENAVLLKDMPPGEWGERMPDNDTLKARRELAEHEPIVIFQADPADYYPPDFYFKACAYCHTFPHAPDCPWLRAQEKP